MRKSNPLKPYDPTIIKLYEVNQFPSDRYDHNPDVAKAFTGTLNSIAGTSFESHVVSKRVEQLRKDGKLAKVGRAFSGPHIH